MSDLARNPAPARAASWDDRLDGENGFDLARLIFATLVVFEHSFYLPYNNYGAEPLYILSGGQTDFGTLAVNGFFAISGFLITRSCLLTDNAARYFKKRRKKLLAFHSGRSGALATDSPSAARIRLN